MQFKCNPNETIASTVSRYIPEDVLNKDPSLIEQFSVANTVLYVQYGSSGSYKYNIITY